ncbi:DUF2268 domain-containing putative Zn-dependent protease [Pseudoneobacillus sp. C159]
MMVGVENTDKWILEHMNNPIKMCEKICNKEEKEDPAKLYQYLTQFGMYRPSKKTTEQFYSLQKNKIWEKVDLLFNHYQKKWNGPNLPIYIFPIGTTRGVSQQSGNKSGVTFPDKLFLFLSDIEDVKEVEALFVHEYHHLCRLNGLNKSIEEYTLLDSLIMEGLAEDAVYEHLGKNYVAKWSNKLPISEFKQYWQRYFEKNIKLNKKHPKHDQLLFGKGFMPNMLGYTMGYNLVRNYRQENSYSTKESFQILSENFIESNICQA